MPQFTLLWRHFRGKLFEGGKHGSYLPSFGIGPSSTATPLSPLLIPYSGENGPCSVNSRTSLGFKRRACAPLESDAA